jgi:hypothetical protein
VDSFSQMTAMNGKPEIQLGLISEQASAARIYTYVNSLSAGIC